MRRYTVHEPQTRVSQAKFLLVLLVLKFTVLRPYIYIPEESCSCGTVAVD
jgi:hypothetical protein